MKFSEKLDKFQEFCGEHVDEIYLATMIGCGVVAGACWGYAFGFGKGFANGGKAVEGVFATLEPAAYERAVRSVEGMAKLIK